MVHGGSGAPLLTTNPQRPRLVVCGGIGATQWVGWLILECHNRHVLPETQEPHPQELDPRFHENVELAQH